MLELYPKSHSLSSPQTQKSGEKGVLGRDRMSCEGLGYVFRIMRSIMWKRMVNDKTEQVGWAQFMQDFGFYPI